MLMDLHHAEAAALAAKLIPSVADALATADGKHRPVANALRAIEDLRDGSLVCRVATFARSIMLDDWRDDRRIATLATMVG